MKKIFKFLLYSAIILVLFCIAGLYTLDRFFSGMCRNEIASELLSPNGKNKVITFQRDCGATTGFSTQISLISANSNLPNEGGNIFISDGHPDVTNVRIKWLSPEKILIDVGVKKTVFKNENQVRGIEILYQ